MLKVAQRRVEHPQHGSTYKHQDLPLQAVNLIQLTSQNCTCILSQRGKMGRKAITIYLQNPHPSCNLTHLSFRNYDILRGCRITEMQGFTSVPTLVSCFTAGLVLTRQMSSLNPSEPQLVWSCSTEAQLWQI